MVAFVSQPRPQPLEIRLLPQEQEGKCTFAGQFVATSNALNHFGQAAVIAALLILQRKVSEGARLDYLQVFEVNGQRLWIIDDGPVVTALLPEDY
jgi:hypothetical protein